MYSCPSLSDAKNTLKIAHNLPQLLSLNASLTLSSKNLSDTDSAINNSPIRKAIARKIAQESRISKVFWREICGLAEIKSEFSPTWALSVNNLDSKISLDLGFSSEFLLFYRIIRPELAAAKIPEEQTPVFPLCAELALQMPLGHEVEIRGIGKLLGSQALNLSQGFMVGAALSCSTQKTLGGEYSLSIMALDGQKRVRVTIAQAGESTTGLDLKIRAGLLKQIIHKKLIIENCANIVADLSKKSLSKESTLCCYDLDLSQSLAQEAYNQLVRLDLSFIDSLAQQENSGVTSVQWQEKEGRSSEIIALQAFSKELFYHANRYIECDGMVRSPNGKSTLYFEKTYTEKISNVISGEQEIRWEGVELIHDNNLSQKYYRFYFEQQDHVSTQKDVDNFFWLASKLGIKSRVNLRSELIEMNDLSKFFSQKDDTRTQIELFFTEAGVAKLHEADGLVGFRAFQRANDHDVVPKSEINYAHNLFIKYLSRQNSWWLWLGFESYLSELSEDYEKKLGRSFYTDYLNFIKAKNFGDLVAKFNNAENKKNVTDFFASLGKCSSLRYREILVALAYIAGRKNILVHKLSMRGGNIALESIDEGEIKHPRDHVPNLFGRL
jgi:hypothetical protein